MSSTLQLSSLVLMRLCVVLLLQHPIHLKQGASEVRRWILTFCEVTRGNSGIFTICEDLLQDLWALGKI